MKVNGGDAASRLVGDHRLEQPPPASEAEFTGSPNCPHRHPSLTGAQLGDRQHLPAVLVAARQQKQDIADPLDSLAVECGEQPGVDPPSRLVQGNRQWSGGGRDRQQAGGPHLLRFLGLNLLGFGDRLDGHQGLQLRGQRQATAMEHLDNPPQRFPALLERGMIDIRQLPPKRRHISVGGSSRLSSLEGGLDRLAEVFHRLQPRELVLTRIAQRPQKG